MELIKVLWHCITNMHRRCEIVVEAVDGTDTYHFCECGYNEPDGKTWEEISRDHDTHTT